MEIRSGCTYVSRKAVVTRFYSHEFVSKESLGRKLHCNTPVENERISSASNFEVETFVRKS